MLELLLTLSCAPLLQVGGELKLQRLIEARPHELDPYVGGTLHVAGVILDPLSGAPLRTSVGAAFRILR